MSARGYVSLVGAGPGDPELITVRGLKRLRSANLVAYDRLVSPNLLDEAPIFAERVYVGKEAGNGHDQAEIERLMIASARQGKHVVRLKGGDPFVFGRGGEEMATLIAAGIPVEVVPGITSAIAAPALAGIPMTHRDFSSSVTIVTGHEVPGKPEESVDWDRMTTASGTLVILMGLSRLESLCTRLIEAGRHEDTPAAVIASGSLPEQRSVTASLADLPAATEEAGLGSPAVIVVGEVVRFSTSLVQQYGELATPHPELNVLNESLRVQAIGA